MEENVIINVKIEGTENEAKIDSLTASIIDLQNANRKLAEENKALAKAEGDNTKAIVENAKQIEFNKQKITENSAQRKGLIQTIVAEDNSIKALSIRNAQLIKDRNLINTSTEAGRKKIAELNALIDKNNSTIKENSSNMEKQRMNIGNYASALDGIVPGLGGFVNGIQGATTAGKAFIATPLGAVLAVIAGALASVSAYFNSSEEAQNRWNKVVAFGTGLLERFMNVIEDVGGFLVDNFVKGFEAVGGVLDGFATSIGINTQVVKDFFNEVSAEAKKFADLQATIDVQERNLIVRRAETAKAVAKLRQEALSQEGETRRKTIQEAIELERKLANQEVELARLRETQAMAELKRNGDDKDAKKAVFEATAARINQEAEFFQATLRFQKEIERLNDQEAKEKEKLNEQRAIELQQKQDLEQVNARLLEQQTQEIVNVEPQIQGKINVNAAQGAVNKANADAANIQKKSIEIDNVKRDSINRLAQSLLMAGQFSKELAVAGILASRYQSISEIVSNTGIANAKAVAASPLTAGMPWVAINTAAAGFAIGATIANAVSSIAGVTAAAGGGNFMTKGPTLLLVGDNPGGVERVTVEPISGKGKTKVGNGMIAMAGGGTLTTGMTASETRIATQQAMSSFNANQMAGLINQVRTVLVLQDFEAVQTSRDNTVNTAEVLG